MMIITDDLVWSIGGGREGGEKQEAPVVKRESFSLQSNEYGLRIPLDRFLMYCGRVSHVFVSYRVIPFQICASKPFSDFLL